MDENPKKSWPLNGHAQVGFRAASMLTLFTMAATIALVVFATDARMDYLNSLPQAKVIGAAFTVLVVVVLIAEVYLWVGMLVFFFRIDRGPFPSKCLWFAALVLVNAWGAAFYYFFVYRPFVKGHLASTMPAPV